MGNADRYKSYDLGLWAHFVHPACLAAQLEELRAEDQEIREAYANEIEELQKRCDEKQLEVDGHRTKFVEFKHQVALNSLNSRSGKPIPPKVSFIVHSV